MDKEKKCQVIDHPNIQKGWGCCSCNIFNGDQRTHCKNCNHARCFFPKVIIENTENVMEDVPPLDKSKLN